MKYLILSICLIFFCFSGNAQQIQFFNIKTNINTNKKSQHDLLNDIIGLPEGVKLSKEPYQTFEDKLGMTHLKYNLSYNDIPIEFSTVILHKDGSNIKSINGEFFEDLDNVKSIIPQYGSEIALNYALSYLNSSKYIWQDNSDKYDFLNEMGKGYLKEKPKGELVLCGNYKNKEDQKVHLAYKFNIWSIEPYRDNIVYVDANNGEVLLETSNLQNINGIAETKYSGTQNIETTFEDGEYVLKDNTRGNGIETYNTTFGTNLMDNDNIWYANSNSAVVDAHWGAMMTYDYFSSIHGRDSYDDNGGKVISIANVYPGPGAGGYAVWNTTTSIMSFSYEQGIYSAMTALDVVAHEFGHGVIQFSANLVYDTGDEESAALSESFADIWGACVENYVNPNRGVWAVGEQIMKQDAIFNPYRLPLRSFSFPKKAYKRSPNTYGGEYWNSNTPIPIISPHGRAGIGNHWFYLLSEGGIGINDNNDNFNVGEISIEKAEQIAYRALTVYFTPNTNYHLARKYTIQAAIDLYEECSQEVVSTTNAWYAVGVGDIFSKEENLLISQTIFSNEGEIFIAEDNIEANNVIEEEANIVYMAGNSIKLLSGFQVESQAEFKAFIEECNGLNFGKSADINQPKNIKTKNEDFNIKNENIVVFPNPFQEKITVNIKELEIENQIDLIIYDSMGREVYYKKFYNMNFNINLKHLSSGIYYVKILRENSTSLHKIIKL